MGRFYTRLRITPRIIKTLLGKKSRHDTVTIHGNERFINATVKALDLLKDKAPEAYEFVRTHVGDIVSGKPSGVFPDMLWLGSTYVIIGASYSEGSTLEYAAAIAHEAYHCELYSKAEEGNPGNRVRPDAYSGEQAEGLCLQFQCDVLRKLGLDEERIKEYRNQLHTRWWEVPIEKQDW